MLVGIERGAAMTIPFPLTDRLALPSCELSALLEEGRRRLQSGTPSHAPKSVFEVCRINSDIECVLGVEHRGIVT